MRASDLSSDQKRTLLDYIKEKIGRDTFEKLVDQVGEDGLIDSALQATSKGSDSSNSDSSSEERSPYQIAAHIITAIVIVIWMLAFLIADKPPDQSGIAGIAGGLLGIALLYFPLFWGLWGGLFLLVLMVKNLHIVIGVPIVIGLVLGAGYLLIKAVGYILSGTASWFEWFFGLF